MTPTSAIGTGLSRSTGINEVRSSGASQGPGGSHRRVERGAALTTMTEPATGKGICK